MKRRQFFQAAGVCAASMTVAQRAIPRPAKPDESEHGKPAPNDSANVDLTFFLLGRLGPTTPSTVLPSCPVNLQKRDRRALGKEVLVGIDRLSHQLQPPSSCLQRHRWRDKSKRVFARLSRRMKPPVFMEVSYWIYSNDANPSKNAIE